MAEEKERAVGTLEPPFISLAQILDYTQLFTAILAAYVALGSVFLQRYFERRNDERKRKAEAYERYLKAFWNSSMDEAAASEYQLALTNLYVTASDEVLKDAADFHKYMLQPNEDIDPSMAKRLYAAMIAEMRRDAYLRATALSEEDISSRLTVFQS